ncbi:hypothetical protein HPB49_020284 [Dermacentor silvarum]|uniref:Uncharacterized protein n=1 Tax=Dermacentor silvarum TaxID=543639 RepID=A0ACB8E2G1_DERSI|nr:hypothetical protein HPB49_020284 [Dermacentor silvarum]
MRNTNWDIEPVSQQSVSEAHTWKKEKRFIPSFHGSLASSSLTPRSSFKCCWGYLRARRRPFARFADSPDKRETGFLSPSTRWSPRPRHPHRHRRKRVQTRHGCCISAAVAHVAYTQESQIDTCKRLSRSESVMETRKPVPFHKKAFRGFADHFKEQADMLLNSLDSSKQRMLPGELCMSKSSSNNLLNSAEG